MRRNPFILFRICVGLMKFISAFGNEHMRYVLIVVVVLAVVLLFRQFLLQSSGPLHIGKHVISYDQYLSRQDRIIPKIIWRTSKYPLRTAPTEIREILRLAAVMNPDYIQIYMDDEEIESFIASEYPQYLRQFKSLIPGAYKADLFRLLVLYKYGGVYNDIGHEYLVPLNEIIEVGDEFIAGTEDNEMGSFQHALHNSMIATFPRNPLIQTMIDTVMEDVGTCMYNSDPLDVSGPAALGHAFNVWRFTGGNDRSKAIEGYTSRLPRGTNIIRGMQIKTLSHDYKKNALILNGKKVINTKFSGFYEVIYQRKDMSAHYDHQWKIKQVYDKSKTDCTSTGVAVRGQTCC